MTDDIWGWTLVSRLAIAPSIFGFLFWWVNTVYGNHGDWVHKWFHRWTQISPLFMVAMFAMANWTSWNYSGSIELHQRSWWLTSS